MYANRQIFFNHSLTARASLRSSARINQFAHSTSVHSFVLCVLNQLTPSRISDAFGKVVVLHHVLDGKIFKEDRAVCVHQFTAEFMGKVFASVGNALVDVRDDLAAFGSFIFGISPLRSPEFIFIASKETRVVYRDTVRECGKDSETHINANYQIVERQGSRFYFTGKTGVPISNSIPLNIQSLDASFDRTMLDYFDCANFGEKQTIIEKFKTCLRVCEAIIASVTPKAWIANLFSMLFYSAKIGLKSKINSCANFLQDLRIYLRQFRLFSFPSGKQFDCVEACDGFLLAFPCVLAGRQSLVIHPTTQLKRLQEFGPLSLGWLKAKLVGLHLYVFLVFNILLDYCKWSAAHGRNEIAVCPQSRKSAFQSGELVAEQERAKTLDPLHKFMDTKLWIDFAKDVNVIGHDLKFDDLTFQFISDLLNDFLQPNIYAVYKYLAAILRTKNNMVLAGVNNMAIAFIGLCAHSTVLYSYSLYSARSKPFLISPRLKAGVLRNIR